MFLLKFDVVSEDIVKVINVWVSVWLCKDMKVYFVVYVNDFNMFKGIFCKVWEVECESCIVGKLGKILVSVDKLQIFVNGDKVMVKFCQSYNVFGLNSLVSKILVFVCLGNKWLIKEENVC